MPARKSKTFFIMGGVLVIALIILLVAQDFKKKQNIDLAAKPTASASAGSAPSYPPGPDLELNAAKEEVAALSDAQIEQETTKLGARLRENDLIHRLNRQEVNDEERKAAKKILVRLALLRIEKARRAGNP